jgi:hypothetical protein
MSFGEKEQLTNLLLAIKTELDKFTNYGLEELKEAFKNNATIEERNKIVKKQIKDAKIFLELINYLEKQIST